MMIHLWGRIMVIATLITGSCWFFQRLPAGRKRERGWIKSSASMFPLLLIVLVIRSFIVEPFKIPSSSMMPTLMAGDFILVEKFAYGIRDPITNNLLIETSHPKRGDVVVFQYPLDPSIAYIKRVIGLPGDRIKYDPIAKRLTVQPASNHQYVITYSDSVTYSSNTYSSNGGPTLRQESLDGVVHHILTGPANNLEPIESYYQQPGQSLAEWVVPQNEYFMMGDNRDNSADSRYWGFVQDKNLVGKATVIWMSFDQTGIRFSRIGRID